MVKIKNKNAGFTLVEILIAMAILVMIVGLSITTISLISQSRAKKTVTTVISSFEMARDYAKTHGGDAMFSIHKVDDGIELIRTSKTVVDENVFIEDKTLKVYYKLTNDDNEYELGENDATSVTDSTLQMTFRQTTGAVLGPHMVDYLIFSNNSKTYKLLIKQSTGMIYYDYEIENDHLNENNKDIISVKLPSFIQDGYNTTDEVTVYLEKKDDDKYATVQPNLNYDSRYIRISGVYRASTPGEYIIIFSLKDPYSTQWEGTAGDTSEKQLVWKAAIK